VEGANVNPVSEIMNLITITRAFESINASMKQNADSQKNAIRTIGSNG
ncbi:MAG: flagellar basal body rod C-terminal domain-containing protein, partial [Pseudomonadota bacterium]